MRIVLLLPKRAANEQNTAQETGTLIEAGHDVMTIASPWSGAAGIVWLEATGVWKASALKPDVVVARDLDALGAAAKVKRRTGAKLVYDMHEVYPWMIERDVPASIVRFTEKRERRLLPDVDLAFTCNIGYQQWLVDQGYRGPMKVIVNCRDPIVPYVPPPNTNTLCYTGTLHPSRFIKEMVEAMQDIDGKLIISGPRTPGSLYDWLEKWCKKATAVQFLGDIGPNDAMKVVQRSDLVVLMADPKSNVHRYALANRLFDAMAVGRPAIGTIGTATGDLITMVKMGITAMYDTDAYLAAVQTLFALPKTERERLGINAYDACVKTFNWKNEAKKMVEAYGSLC